MLGPSLPSTPICLLRRPTVVVVAHDSVVWKLLTDFEHYAGKLPNCKSCKVYSRSKNMMMRTERIKVQIQLDAVVRAFNCYYDHTYAPDKKMLTWTLDPAHTSDFTDVQGQWYIDKHPSKKDCSRVWYTAEVALPPWLPAMMVKRLCNEAGKKSVGFVKKYAEKDWEKEQASAGGMWAKMKAPTEKYKAEMKALTEKMTILEKYEVWRLGYNLDATWLPLLDATKAETKAFTEKYKAEMKALTEKYKAEMKATEKYKAEMKKATAAMSKKADGPN